MRVIPRSLYCAGSQDGSPNYDQCALHEAERKGSGDGEGKMLLTRQIAFEPLPASVLFAIALAVMLFIRRFTFHGRLLPLTIGSFKVRPSLINSLATSELSGNGLVC